MNLLSKIEMQGSESLRDLLKRMLWKFEGQRSSMREMKEWDGDPKPRAISLKSKNSMSV